MRHIAVLLVVTFVAGGGGWAGEESAPSERPWAEQPFLGLSLRDTASGPVVGWIRPGPLRGRGFESGAGIRRGDNLVSVDGHAVDAAGFRAYIAGREVGADVTLVLRRSPDASAESAVPRGGAGGEPYTVTAVLGAKEPWGGLMGRGLAGRAVAPAAEGAFEAEILALADAVGARAGAAGVGGGLDALLSHLAAVQREALDPNAVGAVVQAFERPLSVDRVEASLFEGARKAVGGDPRHLEDWVRGVLGLADPAAAIEEVMGKPGDALGEAEVDSMIRFARQHLEGYQRRRDERRRVEALVDRLRTSVTFDGDDAERDVQTLADAGGVGVEVLLALPLALMRLAPAHWEARARARAGGEPLEQVPDPVRAAVEGEILWCDEDPQGRITVVGGGGANRYDMSRVAMVYDVGGDDHYDYGDTTGRAAIALRVVIDLAGDDVHESSCPFEGPGTAVYGFSLLDDRAGDDVYRSRHAFSIGAGLLGFGILRDRAGNDVYEATGPDSGWGIGVGMWGAGVVLDESGDDVYRGEKLVQGVGGPRGLGAILDAQGRDLYRANGTAFGSAYGTPAVYLGMSQGFGIGIRGYASGGVGAIYDFDGHDRYEAGEFSQAGGYYFGLGVLHDVAGHDLYYGNRYGQAFAAHQAVGVLVDDAGDDTYWSMTAASQAGTWDQSIGLLLDRGGNDAYRCDGLGQGGASMQALALLIDLGGDDRYTGAGASVQGQGGGNAYHYDADKVFSFSALLDRGGGRDAYSSGRSNDTTVATGAFQEAKPENSTLYGVFSDR